MKRCLSIRACIPPLPSRRTQIHQRRWYAIQTPGAPVAEVFDARTKWMQKERAAKDVEASRKVDYLRDEVAFRLCERLLVCIRTMIASTRTGIDVDTRTYKDTFRPSSTSEQMLVTSLASSHSQIPIQTHPSLYMGRSKTGLEVYYVQTAPRLCCTAIRISCTTSSAASASSPSRRSRAAAIRRDVVASSRRKAA